MMKTIRLHPFSRKIRLKKLLRVSQVRNVKGLRSRFTWIMYLYSGLVTVTTSAPVTKTKETQRPSTPNKHIQQKSQTSRKLEPVHANGSRKGRESSDILVEPSPMVAGGPSKRADTHSSKYKDTVNGVRVVLNRVSEPAKKAPQKRKTATETSEPMHKKRTTSASQEFEKNLVVCKMNWF